MTEEVSRELVDELKSVLRTGNTNVNLNTVSLEDFAKALKTATIELLKENVPDLELTLRKCIEQHPDAWLVAEDPKKFYVVRPLTRLELKKLAKMAATDEDLADLVLSECVVYPKLTVDDILNMKAGTVKTLLDTIMAISNFSGTMPVVKL